MPGDQLPMPAQKGLRCHDPHAQQITREHPRQRGQHEPVPRLQPRTSHLPTQHRYLMTQHQQLNILRRLTTTTDHDESKQQPEARVRALNNTPTIMPTLNKPGRAEVFEPHTLPACWSRPSSVQICGLFDGLWFELKKWAFRCIDQRGRQAFRRSLPWRRVS
jgi:hypothetical protein